MPKQFKESDMYVPIKNFFVSMGYEVRGEVKDCDLMAVKGNEFILVEFKKNFNTTLLFQAIDRQKLTPLVYIAVPRPAWKERKRWSHIKHIAKKLGLGLISVAMDSAVKAVMVELLPIGCDSDIAKAPAGGTKRARQKREALLQEFSGMSLDVNKGGSTNVKLNTAFRERCIQLAVVLKKYGPHAAKGLVRLYGCHKDSNRILNNNFYGWFEKVDKGVFALTDAGFEELENSDFEEIVNHYTENM